MFEFYFNYSRSTWERGEFFYASNWPLLAFLVLAVLGAVVVIGGLWRQQIGPGRKVTVALLQIGLLVVALWMVWRPSLRLESLQPGENSVAYLLDTSSSMLNTDDGSTSRLANALALLDDPALTNSAMFEADLYSVANGLEAIASTDTLPADNQRSKIAESVRDVLESVGDRALAAVVLLSDGSDNTDTRDASWWAAIKAAGVPVHTVGFGATHLSQDIELAEVTIDGQAGIESTVTARLRIRHSDIGDARVRVFAGEQLLYADDLDFSDKPEEFVHSINFNSGEAGIKNLRFLVDSATTESNMVNNTQQRMLIVSDNPKRVLYVEGEPRWEYKFLRRALSGYSNAEIVSLLRTSPNKFYRQGVNDADELADGFPASRDALFAYDAIIIGSLEAVELSTEQQANLRDYVNIRGGSLLFIAGRNGLGDGGWGRSAVSAALPVVLSGSNNVSDYKRQQISVEPTRQGYRTSWLQLDEDAATNNNYWSELPAVADIQSVGEPKPGSTVLLEALVDGSREPLLVWHRYGQGQSYVFGTSGTWRWQMRMPSENQWHETFWQQFVSHLVSGSLPQTSFEQSSPVVRDADEFPVSVIARQNDFEPLTGGEIAVNVETPSGQTKQVTLRADINQPGRFTGSVVADEDGPYAVALVQELAGEAAAASVLASAPEKQQWWIKQTNSAEQFNTIQNRPFLERLASETGGQYLAAANVDQLAELLTLQNAGSTRESVLPLWNMPALFILLFLGKLLEWFLRLRWKRL